MSIAPDALGVLSFSSASSQYMFAPYALLAKIGSAGLLQQLDLLTAQLSQAFRHLDPPGRYVGIPGVGRCYRDLTDTQRAVLGVTVERVGVHEDEWLYRHDGALRDGRMVVIVPVDGALRSPGVGMHATAMRSMPAQWQFQAVEVLARLYAAFTETHSDSTRYVVIPQRHVAGEWVDCAETFPGSFPGSALLTPHLESL